MTPEQIAAQFPTNDRQYVQTSENHVTLVCKNKPCKRAGRLEYTAIYVTPVLADRPGSTTYIALQGADRAAYARDRYEVDRILWTPCPACGSRNVDLRRVRGIRNDDKACGPRCRNAKGGDCECSCVGANHGADLRAW